MNVAHHRFKKTNMQMFRTLPRLFMLRKAKKVCIVTSFLESHILITEWVK
jgi:hypothetical protein